MHEPFQFMPPTGDRPDISVTAASCLFDPCFLLVGNFQIGGGLLIIEQLQKGRFTFAMQMP
jgi:hypothetical protein